MPCSLNWCNLSQVYFYMSLLDDHIQNSSLPQRLKKDVREIVSKRWEYLHSDLHGAGMCMDLEFWRLDLNQEVTFVLASQAAINCTGARAYLQHIACR